MDSVPAGTLASILSTAKCIFASVTFKIFHITQLMKTHGPKHLEYLISLLSC